MKINNITENCNTSTSGDNVKGLDLIKKQIAQLILANNKKTEAIKQIDKDLDGMNNFFKMKIDTIHEDLEDLESKINPNADTDEDSEEVELDDHSEESYVGEYF